MKLFRHLALWTLLLVGSYAHAAFVQQTTVSGAASISLTGVSASNKLVLVLVNSTFQTAPTGYTAVNNPATYVGSTSTSAAIFINTAPSAGTNTVTLAANTVGALIEWSGLTASPIDLAPAAVNNTGATTGGSNTVSSGTLSQASEVVFVGFGGNETGAGSTNVATTTPSGFTSVLIQNNSTVASPTGIFYEVVSATTSVTAAITYSDTPTWVNQATMASFKIAGSATTTGSSISLQFP